MSGIWGTNPRIFLYFRTSGVRSYAFSDATFSYPHVSSDRQDKTLFNHVILPVCFICQTEGTFIGGGGGNMETVEITYALGYNMGTGGGGELAPPV